MYKRLFPLVNADRVKRKLPSLLGDGSTSKKKRWNSLMRYRYRFEQFKKKNPEKSNALTNKIIADLTEIEKTVDSLNTINKKKALNHGKN
jgi:hypothetical protein